MTIGQHRKRGISVRIPLISALLLFGASCTFAPPSTAPEPTFYSPLAWLFSPFGPPPGRLILSNYTFDNAHVQTVVTSSPDCAPRSGTAASDFVLPLNGTRVIETAPGSDVCWRRAVAADKPAGTPPTEPGWTEWNRAFTSSGRPIDSRL